MPAGPRLLPHFSSSSSSSSSSYQNKSHHHHHHLPSPSSSISNLHSPTTSQQLLARTFRFDAFQIALVSPFSHHLSFRLLSFLPVGSESVLFEGSVFPCSIASPSSSKPLVLLANGIYDTEIHFLQIKFYSIGAYAEADYVKHVQQWKGKSAEDLLVEDSGFFSGFCQAPVEKLFKVVIIKEVKGSQFVTPLQSSVRDKLAYADKYEDDEEEALDSLIEYFQKKAWLSKDTNIYLHWPNALKSVQVSVTTDQNPPETFEHTIDNENVAAGILQWITGENSFSPSLLKSLAIQAAQSL